MARTRIELPLKQKIAIIQASKLPGHNYRQLAKEYGVSVGTIHNILEREAELREMCAKNHSQEKKRDKPQE
jgi:transposase